jgi:predicted CopG family antitoxin
MSRSISYTTRTFYVPAEKIDTLVEFQGKCKKNGHKSYSEVLLKLMEDYNKS